MLKYFNSHTHFTPINNKEIALINHDIRLPYCSVNLHLNSLGIHPWYLKEISITEALKSIEKNINTIDAIGEAGLDRFIDTSITLQMQVFVSQIHLSEKYLKPMVIHCVRAYSDLLSIRKKLSCKMPWIIHGFMGNKQIAEQLIKKGCFLSFGQAIVQNRPKLKEILISTPSKFHLFETDDDENVLINDVYEKAATIYLKNIAEIRSEKIEIAKNLFSNIDVLL